MLKIDKFKIEYFDKYINLYNEFIKNNSDLVPDILELPCSNNNDYEKILNEIGAKFTNNIKSEYSGKEIKRYVINLEEK